jgi:uncharacterized membrane protein
MNNIFFTHGNVGETTTIAIVVEIVKTINYIIFKMIWDKFKELFVKSKKDIIPSG